MRRARKPVTGFVAFGYSVVDESGTGPMVYQLPSAEPDHGITDALRAHGPVFDVRAIDVGVRDPLIPLPFERERRWMITMIAMGDSYAALSTMDVAMDDTQTALREDLYAGRILPGAHPGRLAPSTPLEAALEVFREETMAELEREEQKRQAGRLKAIRKRGRKWWSWA